MLWALRKNRENEKLITRSIATIGDDENVTNLLCKCIPAMLCRLCLPTSDAVKMATVSDAR